MDENINNYVIKTFLRRRILANKNCLILVVGQTGSGKSYFALELARQLDPTFTIDRCVWDSIKLSRLLAGKLPSGSAIIGDELGIFMSARDWQKKENKALSKAMQTIRFMNHYIIFTVPKESMIDVNARKLFHFIVTAKGRIHGKTNIVDFHRLTDNRRSPEKASFRNPFLYKIKDVQKQTSVFHSRLPPEEMINEYEARRADKIQKMLEKNIEDLTDYESEKVYYCKRCKKINDTTTCEKCKGVLI